MRKDTKDKFIALGFGTELIEKIDAKSYGLTALKGQSKDALMKNNFTKEEALLITNKINRKPIDKDVINAIKQKSGEVCFMCKDGNSSRPFQLHHIEEFHLSQNHKEDNLVLVCPNHHVKIHHKKISIPIQKRDKRVWENLWSIAKKYEEKGLSFPFSSIEYIDYLSGGTIIDVFTFGPPKPSVCVELCKKNLIATDCEKILKEENKLIIAGDSGSGKTTLAYGVAGLDTTNKVYKYTISSASNPIGDCREILYFLSEVSGNIVLIIDDANTKLHTDQIEKILKASEFGKRIIIVNTRNDFKGDSNLEQHFCNTVKFINWNQYQEFVKAAILFNEKQVVEYLKSKQLDQYNNRPIGFSEFEVSLNRVMEAFSKTANNVWQFIYLLGGGLKLVKSKKDELKNTGRFDIVFLFISVKQISEVEKGSSVSDILDLYKRNSSLKQGGEPEKIWLLEQLDLLCSKRILKNERGRYKTIHRQYAIKYIEAFFIDSPKECFELLDEIFKDHNRIEEIVILWSWFRLTHLNIYLHEWYKSPDIDWNRLVKSACETNIFTVGVLADQMHLLARGENEKVLNNAFKYRAEELSKLIDKGEPETLYYFSKLSTTLRYHCNDVFIPLLDAVDKTVFISLIKSASANDFSFINHLFYSISEFYPQWILDLTKMLEFDDFKPIFEKIEKGNIEGISETMTFIRRYVLDIKRSHFKYCTKLIKTKLRNCRLHEIRFPLMLRGGILELAVFSKDLEDILSVLDIDQIACDFVTSPPRHWKNLLSLSTVSIYTTSSIIRNIIDKIDEDLFCLNIEKYYLNSLYEFRVLIYQLCYASPKKRKSMALKLKPYIENLYTKIGKSESDNDVLEAYTSLDENLGKEIVEKFNRTLTEKKRESIKLDEDIVNRIEELESIGEDYEIYSIKLKL